MEALGKHFTKQIQRKSFPTPLKFVLKALPTSYYIKLQKVSTRERMHIQKCARRKVHYECIQKKRTPGALLTSNGFPAAPCSVLNINTVEIMKNGILVHEVSNRIRSLEKSRHKQRILYESVNPQ